MLPPYHLVNITMSLKIVTKIDDVQRTMVSLYQYLCSPAGRYGHWVAMVLRAFCLPGSVSWGPMRPRPLGFCRQFLDQLDLFDFSSGHFLCFCLVTIWLI